MRGLGNAVLRLGANYVETTQWQPGRPTSYSNKSAVIGLRELEEMDAFARASGWTAIHDLNLGANDPAIAAAEAAEARRIGGMTLVPFGFGNEPEHNGKVWRPESCQQRTAIKGEFQILVLAAFAALLVVGREK